MVRFVLCGKEASFIAGQVGLQSFAFTFLQLVPGGTIYYHTFIIFTYRHIIQMTSIHATARSCLILQKSSSRLLRSCSC